MGILMKNLLVLLTAFSLVAGVHAQEAYSNAVGMVKLNISKGSLQMVGIPFIFPDGPKTAEELFGSSLPPDTTIHKWVNDEEGLGNWVSVTYQKGFLGTPDSWSSDMTFDRLDGMFIEIPDGAELDDTYVVSILGTVPDSDSSIQLENGLLHFLSFHYPVAVSISDQRLGLNPSINDTVHKWDTEANNGVGGYVSTTYQEGFLGTPDTWSDPDFTLNPGEGFIYESKGSKSWYPLVSEFYTLN